MNGLEDIVTAAVSAVVGEAGKLFVPSIKGLFKSRRDVVEGVDKVVIHPNSVKAKERLERLLKEALEESPGLGDELRDLLNQPDVIQISCPVGDNNTSIQVVGNSQVTVRP